MRVHPAPKKRNITFRYDINSSLAGTNDLSSFPLSTRQKKLRRLPHIFAKILELPFHSDADVLIQENPDCLVFVAPTDEIGNDVHAHTIEIHPGVTKIVIRGTNVLELSINEFELDLWRFRLPPSTRPELASAAYVDGELVVTVPKSVNGSDDGDGEGDGVWGGEGMGISGVGLVVLCLYSNNTKLFNFSCLKLPKSFLLRLFMVYGYGSFLLYGSLGLIRQLHVTKMSSLAPLF